MSIATISTKVTEAVTAIEAADWSTAKTKLMAAKALLAATPSRTAKEGEELEFDAAAIDSLLQLVVAEVAAGQGVQTSLVEFTNTPDDD